MFTSGQIVVLFIITIILIYTLLMDILKTIRHCVTTKAYSKAFLSGGLSFNEYKELIKKNKEEKKDGNN